MNFSDFIKDNGKMVSKEHYLHEKFEHLYNVAEMILADEVITEGERKLLKRFAIEAGFSDKTITSLIELLLTGIRKGEDEEKLFQRFKKEILFKN